MRKGGKEGKKESGSVSRCESSTQSECESGNAILLAVVVTRGAARNCGPPDSH